MQPERGKTAQVIMAENGHYEGGASISFKADKRQALWDRVQGQVGGPIPKGISKTKPNGSSPG